MHFTTVCTCIVVSNTIKFKKSECTIVVPCNIDIHRAWFKREYLGDLLSGL